MKKLKFLVFGSILIACYAAIKNEIDARQKSRTKTDVRYLPTPTLAKFFALGFKPALADFYWIESINYFGEQIFRKDKNYRYLEPGLTLIETLDPYFQIYYDWASTAFIYNGLPVTRDNVVRSTRVANRGSQFLNEVHRFDEAIVLKSGYNYAIETTNRAAAIPFFVFAARTFPKRREMLVVASTYAATSGYPEWGGDLRLEYFGHLAFEARNKDDLLYALRLLSSSRLNARSNEFIQTLRVNMEKDEELKKIVENRVNMTSILTPNIQNAPLPISPKLQNLLETDFTRTWLPPELHVLFRL